MTKALPLAVVGAVLGAALIGGPASAAPAKETICHKNGKGEYVKIRVSERAEDKHLDKHDDVVAGTPGVVDQDCNPITRVTSPALQFGPNGWGGWSCPAGMDAIAGSTTLTSVAQQEIAQPGDVYPHYTFGANESGYVVQNDNDSETGTVTVDCV
jgi:hypothetical protein